MIDTRIKALADEIKGYCLADIGTDHGYIPITAIKLGKVQRAIACDIKQKPLLNAKNNISKANFEDKIEVRLGPGLSPIKEGEADTICIAGLGGDVMCNILRDDQNVVQSANQLVLSPHTKVDMVRRLVHTLGFDIKNEVIVKEGSFYHVLNRIRSGEVQTHSDREYYIGKVLLENKSEMFIEYVEFQKKKLKTILKKVENADEEKVLEIKTKIAWLEV